MKSIDEIRSRILCLEKQLKQQEHYRNILVSFAGAIFAVVGVIFSFNLYSERTILFETQKEIKDETKKAISDMSDFKEKTKDEIQVALGEIGEPPKLEVRTENGDPIEDRDVEVSIDKDEKGQRSVAFYYSLFNAGGSNSGPITLKVYTSSAIELSNNSSDERGYEYEAFIYPKSNGTSELPAGASNTWTVTLSPVTNNLEPGRYPMLMKFYYGKKEVTTAKFYIIIK